MATHTNRQDRPIGVFDSGLGGLTVVKALMQNLPHEDIVYFGDTARVPYGIKSPEAIVRFSKQNVHVLLHHRVKMIVVACNSSSAYALGALKKTFNLPIVGVIEPGAQKALETTRKKIVGVIATPATINSRVYCQKIRKLDPAIRVISQPCPLFVPLVEEGWFRHKVTVAVAREYLKKIKSAQADTLILGCTHYPLLKKVLADVLGRRITLVDSAHEVALEVKRILSTMGLSVKRQRKGRHRFLVSDAPTHFKKTAKSFLGTDIKKVSRVKF